MGRLHKVKVEMGLANYWKESMEVGEKSLFKCLQGVGEVEVECQIFADE